MPYFEDLEVWKQSCRLTVKLYQTLQKCQDYGLRDQMTRAAVSIPSNIAEGAERRTAKEYVSFLYISKGSAGELRTQIYIASKIGIISSAECKSFTAELKKISSMLQAMISKLSQKSGRNAL